MSRSSIDRGSKESSYTGEMYNDVAGIGTNGEMTRVTYSAETGGEIMGWGIYTNSGVDSGVRSIPHNPYGIESATTLNTLGTGISIQMVKPSLSGKVTPPPQQNSSSVSDESGLRSEQPAMDLPELKSREEVEETLIKIAEITAEINNLRYSLDFLEHNIRSLESVRDGALSTREGGTVAQQAVGALKYIQTVMELSPLYQRREGKMGVGPEKCTSKRRRRSPAG